MDELIKRAIEKLDLVLDSPLVGKDEVIPMMNELAAIVGKLYLLSHDVGKEESKKVRDIIKGLEGLIGTLKYQYRSYAESRWDDVR